MRRVPKVVWAQALLLAAVAWLDQGPWVCPRRNLLARAWRSGLALLLHLGVRLGALLLGLAVLGYLLQRGRAGLLAQGASRAALTLGLLGLLLVGLQRLG